MNDTTTHHSYTHTFGTLQRVNGFQCVPHHKGETYILVNHFSLLSTLSSNSQLFFKLEVGVLERQLVPSSARHTPGTLQVDVLSPVILPFLRFLKTDKATG